MAFRVLFIFCILMSYKSLLAQTITPNPIAQNLKNGLVAYYPFNGNANDESGNGNNGNVFGAILTNDRFGKNNSAYSFDESKTDYIIGDASKFPSGNSPRSISFWIRARNLGNGLSHQILGYGGESCGQSFNMNLENSDIGPNYIGKYEVQGHCRAFQSFTSFPTPNTNVWHHIVVTYDGSIIRFYNNGVLAFTSNPVSINTVVLGKVFVFGREANQLGTGAYFEPVVPGLTGELDEIWIHNRALTAQEVNQLFTNATCSGSLTYDVFPNVINIAGNNTVLDAGAGYASYVWSTGATQQTIAANTSGYFKVTVTDQSGCTGSDSTFLNLFFAEIKQNDTTICLGSSITLSIDSTSSVVSTACTSSQLPTNLQNGLVAYYPFCGNANDASGNGNNGIVNGASLTTDRFGNANSAYNFNGNAQYISVVSNNLPQNDRTVSAWINVPVSNYIGMLMAYGGNGICGTSYFIGLNHRGTDKIMVSGHCANNETQATYVPPANVWVNIVAVSSSNGTKIYANGILVGSTAAFFSNTLGSNMFIGSSIDFAGINPYEDGNGLRWLGKIDDFILWNRALSEQEVKSLYTNQKSISWSNGATSNSITVTPTQTTKYFVTISDGATSFTDSVTVNIDDLRSFNPLSDTLRVCNNVNVLDAGVGLSNISWSTGASSQSISASISGQYKFSANNANGCIVSDSTYLSLINAKILQNDTTICLGSSLTLSIDSASSVVSTACTSTQLPTNLQNGLVAYYPFCGNANDASGNGNNGIVNGASLTTDRFGNANSAYYFNGNAQYISVVSNNLPQNDRTVSAWINIPISNYVGMLMAYGGNGICGTSYFIGLNHRGTDKIMVSGHCANNETQATYVPPANVWVNIVAVSSSNGTKIYANGILVGSSAAFFSNTLGSNMFIGSSIDFAGINPYEDGNGLRWLGKIDDFILWNRALSEQEVKSLYANQKSVSWSNGATSNSITVTPTQTTKYFVTVSDGITTCTDSILVKVNNLSTFNPLPDTIRLCGVSAKLDAGINFSKYSWSTGETQQIIEPQIGGKYFVTVTDNLNCTISDSTYLSLVNANISQNDTTICLGSSITLSIDSASSVVSTACTSTQLPTNLQNGLVAYYPFCGNANDASGNSNNGIVNGAILTQDRFGNANSAYSFNGTSSFIEIPSLNNMEYKPITYSAWINTNTLFTSSQQVAGAIIGRDQSGNYSQGVLAFYSEKVSGIDNEIMYYTGDPQPLSTVSIAKYKINTNNWYHIVFTMELNGDWKFYVNGNLTNSGPLAVAQFKNLPFRIGASDGRFFWNGMLDDIAVWNRVLNDSEVKQLSSNVNSISWSNGATSKSITVSPTQSTKYYVTVSDGITVCSDSILVNVNNLTSFNPLLDTTRLCGVSAKLDAGVNFSKYSWSTGETQQIIEPQIGGKYFVTVTDNLNCTVSDSTYLSLVNANISQNDTSICNGGSITLSVDTVLKVINTFGSSLPTNLKSDLVAYYPFNGNANDESGNNNHATVYNARLTTDRFGRPNSAYAFSPTDRSSIIPGVLNTSMVNSFTYSVWVKPLNTIVVPPQGQAGNAASGYPNNTCVIHPIHGQNYGPPTLNTGTGVYVGINGVYLEEHSDGWEAVPISHQMNLTGWHLINIVYENKIPTLYIDGVFIKKGIPSPRQIYASLGPDRFPTYGRSGIGAGYIPGTGTTQFFNGDIDDIYFYKRALNSNEVTQIYNGALSVRWSTGDTTSRITVTPSATTKYFVTVSDGITTCTDSILVKVNNLSTFNPLPDTLSKCGKNIILDAGGNFQTYNWSTGSTIRNITVTQGGKYTINAVTADGCKASDSTIVSLVDVNIDNRDTTICSLSSLNIGLSSSFTYKYRWSTGDITPSIVVNPIETTTYYVKATDDITTCTDSIKVSVELPAKGIRYPTQDIIVNRPTELTARNFGKAYLWTPDLQLNSPRLLNPIITPTKQQQYTVKIVTDAGCTTIDTVLIRVFPDRNIYVPEGFTPDADGRNDRLYPIPVGIREMRTFRIYNRWGTLIFDNKNANINNGWDGTYLGTAQPMESYVWIAEGIDIDGKFIRRSGNTILIR